MRRHQSPDSQDSRLSEQRLQDFLVEYSNVDVTKDSKSFCQNFVNTSDLQNSIFRFLSKERDHSSNDIEVLQKLCQFFLFFYRTITSLPGGGRPQSGKSAFIPASTANEIMKNRVIFVQFIPHWLSIHLIVRYSHHRSKYQFLDAFLLSIYNAEAVDQPLPVASSSSNPTQRPPFVKVPSLASSSLYHDSSRLESEDKLDQRPTGLTFSFESFSFIDHLTSSTRPVVLRLLMQSFNRQITDVSKSGLDHFTRCSLKLLERGYGSNSSQIRIPLEPPIMIEYLFSAYVCMYNGFQVAGNQILDHIHNRASVSGSPEVLLLSNSIKSLVLASSPSQVQSAHVSTPVQIAKNMITSASFRAKKLHMDIPKVQIETSEDGTASGSGISRNQLISMASIVEEGDAGNKEESDKGATSKGESSNKGFKLDNLKSKLRKKALSVSEEGSSSGAGPDQPLLKPKASIEKKDKKDHRQDKKKNKDKEKEKEKEKERNEKDRNDALKADKTAEVVPETLPLVSGLNGDSASAASTSSKEYDTLEKVEELIQMKKLPAETITIHSPESGTTIF